MENLEQLVERRDVTHACLIELEKAIARHPETIKKAFIHNPEWNCDKFEDLISKITFIRWNKTFNFNVCNFVVDEKIYHFYKKIGVLTTAENIDDEIFEITENFDLWNQDDPIEFLESNGIDDILQQICYLLSINK